MLSNLQGARIGVALTGSFCTLGAVFDALPTLTQAGATLVPILSTAVSSLDTRFFTARAVKERVETICGVKALETIPEVEPIGPTKMLDLLIVAPCTGNTCAKMANGIADTPVTLAVKSHLRNARPILVGISSNDALGVNARSIGTLLSRKHMYFVPFAQDDWVNKPMSLVFEANLIAEAADNALIGRQIQPLLRQKAPETKVLTNQKAQYKDE